MSKPRRCSKRRFRDHNEAVTVLHRIQTIRHWHDADGTPTHRHERRCYACDRCRGYHLTSQA